MFPASAARKWVSAHSFQDSFQHQNCSHLHYRTKISMLLMLLFWWGMCYKATDNICLLVSPGDVSDKGNMFQHIWINMCLKERNGWVYSSNESSLSRKKPNHFEEQSVSSQTLLLSWHENILVGCVQVSVGFPLKFTLQSFQPKKWIKLTVFTKLFVGRGWKTYWYSLPLTTGFPKKKHNCWNT